MLKKPASRKVVHASSLRRPAQSTSARYEALRNALIWARDQRLVIALSPGAIIIHRGDEYGGQKFSAPQDTRVLATYTNETEWDRKLKAAVSAIAQVSA